MTADTTAASYWLNWRFLVCAIWIFTAMVLALLLIRRYEASERSRSRGGENQEVIASFLSRDEVWRTTSKAIHPVWLLAYRILAFTILLALLIADTVIHGGRIFYFYTQWTFALVTIYFGLGSSLSVRGCLYYFCGVGGMRADSIGSDAEQGSYVAPTLGESSGTPSTTECLNRHVEAHGHNTAGAWEYAFQIIFQTCAGAVTLTDIVFWLIIYPTSKDYRLHFLVVCMHSVNAIVLIGDVMLNSLRFPFFRVAYFVLWTCIFVVFQWIIHACVSMRWPYAFLDLSSPYAPIWYLAIGLLLFPCFGAFSLIYKTKRFFLSHRTRTWSHS